jgi:mannose-1-phosphate guanylyltransferase
MKIIPVILCGGAGTRLWPQSKKNIPKQFVDWGGWTLFEKTLERVKSSIFDYPIVTTNLAYLNLVKKYVKKSKIEKYKIILEPYKKNTAPAILSPALLNEIPYNQPMIFFTSDNLIGKVELSDVKKIIGWL